MDYLQYIQEIAQEKADNKSFKPYYKWITFNTKMMENEVMGLVDGFKPYYKWITFNTSLSSKLS